MVTRDYVTDLTPADEPWQMFGLQRSSPAEFFRLQRRNQRDGSFVGEVLLPMGADAIAYDRAEHRVLVSRGLSLYAVDPDTGASVDLGRSVRAKAMAYHEGFGLLFAVTESPLAFWGWDEARGEWTNISPMATPAHALAYNPADGHLYLTAVAQGASGDTESLFRIDPGTGQRQEVGRFAEGVIEGVVGLVFTTEPHCYADCDGDGTLDVFDLLCYMNLFQDGDDLADCNRDGTLNLFDFICFQSHFDAGCD